MRWRSIAPADRLGIVCVYSKQQAGLGINGEVGIVSATSYQQGIRKMRENLKSTPRFKREDANRRGLSSRTFIGSNPAASSSAAFQQLYYLRGSI
eukprot:gene21756-28778_t